MDGGFVNLDIGMGMSVGVMAGRVLQLTFHLDITRFGSLSQKEFL
jgi:hypothetical protein